MSNIVDFTKAKKAKKANNSAVQIDPLERVKQILSPPKEESMQDVIKTVKGILRSKGIKYRISHKEINEIYYPKNQTILFPEHKLLFVISKKKVKEQCLPSCWTLESIKLDSKVEAIDCVAQIISRVEELSQNVTKQAQE